MVPSLTPNCRMFLQHIYYHRHHHRRYVAAAEKCVMAPTDMQKKADLGPDTTVASILMRDAYKKCINIFVELSSTPESQDGAAKGKVDKGNKSERAVPEEKGTLEMLNLYGPDEVDEKEEEGDLKWFKKFGKCRAQQLFLKLRTLKEKKEKTEKKKKAEEGEQI